VRYLVVYERELMDGALDWKAVLVIWGIYNTLEKALTGAYNCKKDATNSNNQAWILGTSGDLQ